MKQIKIFLLSVLAIVIALPAVAVPTNTGSFPGNGLMQPDYTYTNAATSGNMDGVYDGNVNAVPQYTDDEYTVTAGNYLPAGAEELATCTAGNFCPGLQNTVNYSATNNQGLETCSSGYTSNAGASAQNQCYINVSGGHYIGTSGQNSSNWDTCTAAQYKEPHTVNYGSTSSCSSCPSGYTADTSTGKSAIGQCQITCAAGNYMASGTYTRLEYLESSGTQYIDLGYTKAQVANIEVNLSLTRLTDTYQIFYGLVDDVQCAISSRGTWVNYGSEPNIVAGLNVWYDTKLDLTTRKLYIDDVDVATGNAGSNTRHLQLFGYDNSYNYKAYIKVSSVKAYSLDGALVQNLIPVRRNNDSVLGMFDLVTGTFFTNAGTGTFTAGPDVGVIGGTCSAVGSGYYSAATTVGYGSTVARSACSDLGYPTGFNSGTFSSVSPYDANTTCRYTAPDASIPINCSGITKNAVAYSGSSWGTNFYTVTSDKGKYITANNNSAPTCAVADSGYYVDTTNATGQTQCPADYRAGSDNGRDDIADCYRTCTTADVAHSANVTGHYYSDDTNACEPTETNGCVTGYHYVAAAEAPGLASCEVTSYDITYNMNDGTNYAGAPATYTYGTGATISGVPTRVNYVFAGWCTDSELTTCAMTQTIATDATDDKTFWAKWSECPACATEHASCTFDGVENNACKYTTACDTGYGNIQNNGAYNASCTANIIELYWGNADDTYQMTQCTYGGSITTPTNAPTKRGHTFTGWTFDAQ